MRKRLAAVLGLVLVASVVLLGCGSESGASTDNGLGYVAPQGAAALAAGDYAQQTGIWVSGTGTVTVEPDLAVLRLGVEAQAATVTEAQSQASTAMGKVMAALTASGVAQKDIQTQWFSISPVTKWVEDKQEQITIGYRVSNMVTVKIRDMSKVGVIIDAVAEAGGDLTRVDGISFTVDDPTPYYEQARAEAMADAMGKAGQMASIADVTLGKAFYISESGGYIPPTPYPVRSYADAGSASTPISVGELEVSLTVQMAFAIQ